MRERDSESECVAYHSITLIFLGADFGQFGRAVLSYGPTLLTCHGNREAHAGGALPPPRTPRPVGLQRSGVRPVVMRYQMASLLLCAQLR